MSRRMALFLAALASLAVVACNATPAAPPLTDPKEILVKSMTAMQTAKTMELHGTFGGSVNAPGMGQFDLSSVKLDVTADVAGKKARVALDAPSLLGTKLDVIALTDAVYLKMVGPMAGMAGLDTTGKYTQMPVDSGLVPDEATDPAKAIEELRKGLDDLPSAPEKLADEKCGDTDCYHVRIALTGEDIAALSPGADAQLGAVSLDVLTRKSDLRPARMSFSIDAGEQGTITGTFDLSYDTNVDIQAPPADQVVQAPG